MKAEDIQSADDLEVWLNGLPEEQALQVAPLIASRAALRLFPVWAECCAHLNGKESEDSRSPHFFNGLRCYNFMLVLSQPRPNGKRVYDFSTPFIKISFRLPGDFSKYPVLAAITGKVAFEAAACALSKNTTSRAVRATQDALGCTKSVLLSYSQTASIFSIKDNNYNHLSVISSDAISFEEGQEFLHLPLWPIGEDPIATIWAEAAPLFDRHPAWSVFKDLYENALHARPQNWPLLNELAQKDEAFWTGTDTEVLDRIAEVMEGFERIRLLDETRAVKGLIEQALPEGAASAFQRSDNNPPELIENAEPQQQVLIIWAGLDQVEHELSKAKPDKSLLAEIAGWVKKALLAFLRKCGD